MQSYIEKIYDKDLLTSFKAIRKDQKNPTSLTEWVRTNLDGKTLNYILNSPEEAVDRKPQKRKIEETETEENVKKKSKAKEQPDEENLSSNKPAKKVRKVVPRSKRFKEKSVSSPLNDSGETKTAGSDSLLKFVTWNANHFSQTNDLSEKEMLADIKEYIEGASYKSLPDPGEPLTVKTLFTQIKNASKVAKRKKEFDKADKIGKIKNALKNYYLIKHGKSLMTTHPDLILGFNEINDGDFLQEKMEGEKKGGITVKKGPHFKSTSQTKNDHEESKKSEKKKKTGSGQNEYYPVVYNASRYNYKGCFIMDSKGKPKDVKEGEDIPWTKFKHFQEKGIVIPYRPIVVHKLKRKDEKSEKGNEIWYGIVHTSPYGNEFERRKIYTKQLERSLPALRTKAVKEQAFLVIGGDYYIAKEALVRDPDTLRKEGSRARGSNFIMDEEEVENVNKERTDKLTFNRSIGETPEGEKFTGSPDEIRNLISPDDKLPYNFVDTLEHQDLVDVRPITGTNQNELGLQQADFFILPKATNDRDIDNKKAKKKIKIIERE